MVRSEMPVSTAAARYQDSSCRKCGGTERYSNSRKCVACDVASSKAWREANLEKSRADARARYEANKASRKATAKAWREANAEKRKADHRAWREANPGRSGAIAKAWREANPERSKAGMKAWKSANQDSVKAYNKAYRAANLEEVRLREKDWREANRERIFAKNRNRVARQKNASGRHSSEEIEAILKAQKHKCAMCRVSVKSSRHVDHIMPLKLGGKNDRTNLQILCPTCNLSKGAKHPLAFAREIGRLL